MGKRVPGFTRSCLSVLALFALAALTAACSGGDGNSAGPGQVAEPSQETIDALTITIRTEGVAYHPAEIRVKVGQIVRLTLENADPILHDFTTEVAAFVVLDSRGADHQPHDGADAGHFDDGHGHDERSVRLHVAADAGLDAELVFRANEPGEYTVYCTVEGHRESGMEAKIIVES